MSRPDPPQDADDDAEEVAELARALKGVIARRGVAYDAPGPRASAIVASALCLIIVEVTQRVDPLFTSVIITNLGGNPFGRPQ